MPLENFSESKTSSDKRNGRRYKITTAHGTGSLTEGSKTYGQMKTSTVYTGGESGMKEGSRVKKVEFLNNTTEQRKRETQYFDSGRKVTRFEDRVEVVYGDGKITDPQQISKEIYYKGRKITIYGDGREVITEKKQEAISSAETKKESESKVITNTKLILEAAATDQTDFDPSIRIRDINEYKSLSDEVTRDEVVNLSKRINKARELQKEIDLLQSQIILEPTTQSSPIEPKVSQPNRRIWSIFSRKDQITATDIDKPTQTTPEVSGKSNSDLKAQIEILKTQLSEVLNGLNIEGAVNNKNDLIQQYIIKQLEINFLNKGSIFANEQNFSQILPQYSLFKNEISAFASQIFGKESTLFDKNSDLDFTQLQDKITTHALTYFESPYGLNMFLELSAINKYQPSFANENFIEKRFLKFVSDFIGTPSYSSKSEFISDPRFLKLFTSLALDKKRVQMNFGSFINSNVTDIYRCLSTIFYAAKENNKDIADIISLIPDTYNPNTDSNRGYINFYSKLYDLLTNKDSSYTRLGYVRRFPDIGKKLIKEIFDKTPNPTSNFLNEAIIQANDLISQTTLANRGRVISELNSRENFPEISSTFANDSLIAEFFRSNELSESEKERFFIEIRDDFERKPTFNRVNSFLSSIYLGDPRYKNSYLTQHTLESIQSFFLGELRNPKECNSFSNPNMFKLLGESNKNVRGDLIYSQLFSNRDITSNDKYSKLRSFYGKYVVNLYPETKEQGDIRRSIIDKMNLIYPSGLIFKNLIEDADALELIYQNLEQEFPYVFGNPEGAKTIIEKVISNNRNVSVTEFKDLLLRANTELASK